MENNMAVLLGYEEACYISAGGSPLVFDLFAGRLVP